MFYFSGPYSPVGENKTRKYKYRFSRFIQALPLEVYIKARSHRQNFAWAVLERWKKSSPLQERSRPFTIVKQKLATVKATLYMLGHRWWSLLPLWKFWAAQNIASGEERSIFRSSKVHHRYTNAQAPLDESSWTLWTALPTQKSLNAGQPLLRQLCPGGD